MAVFYTFQYMLKEGRQEEFRLLQSRALGMLRWYGGEIITAYQPEKQASGRTPDEIQVIKFPSAEKYQAFIDDPEQASLQRQIAETVLEQAVYISRSEINYENTYATVVSSGLGEQFRLEKTAKEEAEFHSNAPTLIVPPMEAAIHPAQRPQFIDTVLHQSLNPAQNKLTRLVLKWQKSQDKRVVFAHTYLLMTTNMLEALDKGEYEDGAWVRKLLERFGEYYFEALADYEKAWFSAPPVWRIAFQVAENAQSTTAQNLLLGVNAHINNDLVLTLIDLLKDEWPSSSPSRKEKRYQDHTHVNQVIARTMEATQDEIISRYSPILDALNKVSFNMDFVVISRLINRWREQVWHQAAEYLDLEDRDARHRVLQRVEYTALRRADVIMLKQGPFKMKGLE